MNEPKYPAAWYAKTALQVISKTPAVIYKILPAGGLCMIYGPSGAGKTFFILNMWRACALGLPWMGYKTELQTAILIAAEGGYDVHARHAGVDQVFSAESPVLIDQARPPIDAADGFWYLLALISEVAPQFEFVEILDFRENCPKKYVTNEESTVLEKLASEVNAKKHAAFNDYDPKNENASAIDAWRTHVDLLKETKVKIYAEASERYTGRDAIFQSVFAKGYKPTHRERNGNVLLAIDTFSATAADDTKPTVAAYFRNIKNLQERVAAQGGCLTVVFIDHSTKAENTFQGAGAKFNDVDAVFEITRRGKHGLTLKCEKQKFFAPFEDMQFHLMPIEIAGHVDAMGAPLTTLACVDDATYAPTVEPVVKAAKATAASMLIELLVESGQSLARSELRAKFYDLPSQKTKAQATKAAAFRRAVDDLQDECLIAISEDDWLSLTQSVT